MSRAENDFGDNGVGGVGLSGEGQQNEQNEQFNQIETEQPQLLLTHRGEEDGGAEEEEYVAYPSYLIYGRLTFSFPAPQNPKQCQLPQHLCRPNRVTGQTSVDMACNQENRTHLMKSRIYHAVFGAVSGNIADLTYPM